MLNIDKFAVGMLFIGAALGTLVPGFTGQLAFLGGSLPILFLVVGVIFLIMR